MLHCAFRKPLVTNDHFPLHVMFPFHVMYILQMLSFIRAVEHVSSLLQSTLPPYETTQYANYYYKYQGVQTRKLVRGLGEGERLGHPDATTPGAQQRTRLNQADAPGQPDPVYCSLRVRQAARDTRAASQPSDAEAEAEAGISG